MRMNVIDKINEMGLILPTPTKPGGNYVPVNVRGKIAYVAIQFPLFNGTPSFLGRLGDEMNTHEGYKAAQLCALNVLAQIDFNIGFENIEGLNHLDIYYQSTADWDNPAKVANGASDLFVETLGEMGKHTRAIIGAERLVKNFCVGLVANFTIK